jgi:succinate-acetate transporter protein
LTGALLALSILGILFLLVWLVFDLVILVQAFAADWMQGLLCLLVPLYIVYWMLARLRHARRRLLVGGYFVGLCGFLACSAAAWALLRSMLAAVAAPIP